MVPTIMPTGFETQGFLYNVFQITGLTEMQFCPHRSAEIQNEPIFHKYEAQVNFFVQMTYTRLFIGGFAKQKNIYVAIEVRSEHINISGIG